MPDKKLNGINPIICWSLIILAALVWPLKAKADQSVETAPAVEPPIKRDLGLVTLELPRAYALAELSLNFYLKRNGRGSYIRFIERPGEKINAEKDRILKPINERILVEHELLDRKSVNLSFGRSGYMLAEKVRMENFDAEKGGRPHPPILSLELQVQNRPGLLEFTYLEFPEEWPTGKAEAEFLESREKILLDWVKAFLPAHSWARKGGSKKTGRHLITTHGQVKIGGSGPELNYKQTARFTARIKNPSSAAYQGLENDFFVTVSGFNEEIKIDKRPDTVEIERLVAGRRGLEHRSLPIKNRQEAAKHFAPHLMRLYWFEPAGETGDGRAPFISLKHTRQPSQPGPEELTQALDLWEAMLLSVSFTEN